LVHPQCDRAWIFFAHSFHGEQMVLSFQAQEVAREDVQKAQLPASSST
jgi:hypothetical protein